MATKTGLRHGDVLVAADGHELESHFAFQRVVGGHESGVNSLNYGSVARPVGTRTSPSLAHRRSMVLKMEPRRSA